MKQGMYVRCPVIKEEADHLSPRYFVLGYIKSVNEFAQTVTVSFIDTNSAKKFYEEALEKKIFGLREVHRCAAPPGTSAVWKKQRVDILAVDTKVEDSEDYYTYYLRTREGEIREAPENEVGIDFTQMDFDPLTQMKRYELHQPTWYLNRLVVSNTMHALNNAVFGFKVLAGCRAFLLPHQIVTIVRCLESTPVRYMLADEVGLGKTIEACAIVKILCEQNTRFRVVYVIPDPLVDQWLSELSTKFKISAEVNDGRLSSAYHVIVPLTKFKIYCERIIEIPDMLIVDETHRLLFSPAEYDAVEQLSRKMEHILLLSATPIQDRKQELLKLLVLLHPELYGQMPLQTFGDMVEKQSRIQQRIYGVLGEIDEFESYYASIKKRLATIATELMDATLQQLVSTIDDTDSGQDHARQAIAYICEHYRLERRVVRNRRQMLRDKMPERRLHTLTYSTGTADEGYDERSAIEETFRWLRTLDPMVPGVVDEVIKPVISAAFSSPWALRHELRRVKAKDAELSSAVESWYRAAEREIGRLEYYLDENPDQVRGRLLRIVDYIEQETRVKDPHSPAKLLIFSAFPETLTRLADVLRVRLGEDSVTLFTQEMEREDLQASADTFQSNPLCCVMLCDETGGEGRNFQFAEMIIHLDLPWTPNSLEQRIGRLDRLGRPADRPVTSLVIYARDTLEEKLFKLWHEGMGIFTQSLSGLEIITGEISKRVNQALREDLVRGLDDAYDEIINLMQEMRDTVEEEQLYDAAAMLYRPLTKTIERMLEVYQGKEDDIFSRAMLSWASQAGLVPTHSENGGLCTFSEDKFSTKSAVNAMLLPPKWSVYQTLLTRYRSKKITGTFSRKLAITREDVLFFAPGDTIFDNVVDNAISCGRGRSCALSLPASIDYKGLVMVWNVEPQISILLKAGVKLQLLSQFRAYLPMDQVFTFFPLDESSTNVDGSIVRKELLRRRATYNPAVHLGKRSTTDKGGSTLKQFVEEYPPLEWDGLLTRARKDCRKQAMAEIRAAADIPTAIQEVQRILDAHQASCLYFGKDNGDNARMRETYSAVIESLSKARLVLDSVAYVKLNRVSEDG